MDLKIIAGFAVGFILSFLSFLVTGSSVKLMLAHKIHPLMYFAVSTLKFLLLALLFYGVIKTGINYIYVFAGILVGLIIFVIIQLITKRSMSDNGNSSGS